MKSLSTLKVFLAVITDFRVIGATLVVLLYCNFVVFVTRYKKRPLKIRLKKKKADAPAPASDTKKNEKEADADEGDKSGKKDRRGKEEVIEDDEPAPPRKRK